MSDYDMESDLTSVGSGGTLKPSGSPSGDQQSSTVSPDLEAVSKKVSLLEKELRALQSGKDRGVSRVSKRIDELQEQLDRYDEYLQSGLKPAQARRELQIDALLASQNAGTSSGVEPNPTGSRGVVPGADYNKVIAGFGLDANSAEVTEILSGNYDQISTIGMLAELAQAKKQTTTTNQPPNVGQMVPSNSGRTVTPDLEERFLKERDGLRRGDAKGLQDLKLKYRKLAREAGVKFEH